MSSEIHRSIISFSGCALLYLLFFLHICTAFVTVINALNDKEEILQLSVDTFHIVDSDESHPKLNIDDNEEKELLLALLTSYDDIQMKTIDQTLPSVDSSSSIRFLPSSIHFSQQSIAIPRMQTFEIINDESEPLQILSILGATNEFYFSNISRQDEQHLSMNIYYLPRTIGYVETMLIFKTNRGNFSYHISGFGIDNPYRLRPLINIEIPINVTYEHTIQFYNPYNYSLHINEIYTSDENLIIELLNLNYPKNRLTKTFQYHEQWYLNAYETKSIVKIQYSSLKVHFLNGFICIKTNLSETFILPIEIHISNRSDLYSNIDLLELSSERFLRSDNRSIKIPVYAFNYGSDPILITDIRVPIEYERFLQVQYKTLPIPSNIDRLNQIADVIIDLNSIPRTLERLHGSIDILTSRKSQLKIRFNEKFYYGSLNTNSDETELFLSNQTENKHCQIIRIYNRFQTIILVHSLTIDNFDLLSNFIQIKYPSSNLNLYPNQWNNFICLTFSPQSKTSLPNIQTNIKLFTNLSSFSIPIHLYNGLLELDILTDHTNGGIQRNEVNPLEFFLSSIPVNTSRSVRFILLNSNPIDIEIEKFQSNLDIQLDYMKNSNGNQTKIRFEEKKISSLIIPKHYQAIFLLTINRTNLIQSYDELLTIQTHSQILSIHFKYEIINSSLEFLSDLPLSLNVYPNRLASTEISLYNKFPIPIQLIRIHFLTYGLCFSLTSIENILLQSNQIQKIGRLNFDLTSLCQLPEWTFYCHSNRNENILRNNMFHQIQTNLWIYSNQVNISVPILVNFLWPSVIEENSSIVDFHLTYINTTKIDQFIIKNPISDLIEYSIELSNENNSSFSISTTSKKLDQIHHFKLHPNEQISFTVSYYPQFLRRDQTNLIIRNNFTRIESISLIGEGGIGNLEIGSSKFPIIFEINKNLDKFCSNRNGNSIFEKILTMKNTGNMLTIIHDISFGSLKCTGQGFSVAICEDIRIEANEKSNLLIIYQPDYTTDEINETMILNTNIGQIIVPISIRIPQQILSMCYKSISRPVWDIRPYYICLCGLILFIFLIFLLALFDARKSYDNYLIRLEWRDNIQVLNNKIFDLKDLSLAIHDEQKSREQIETLEINDVKKEQPKPKRSFNSNSNRNNPKVRRATVDSGPSKSTKVNKREEKKTSISTIRPRSSTTVSEEEHEPLTIVRTKRALNKRKGSSIESQPLEENDDQQWQTVSCNRGQKKANLQSRQSNSDEFQSIKKSKTNDSSNHCEQTFHQSTERDDADEDEEIIDWDEPNIPDEDFGRYASQTEHFMDESNEEKSIPPLMSLNIPSSTVAKENIEPLPLTQPRPGPIQRPMHLPCSSTVQSISTTSDTPQTPNTPDVLVQINHLVDHQNSLSTSSTLINDLPTPNVSWTPFTPTEWSSPWSTTITTNQNPFVQRQISKDDSSLWSSANVKDSWLKFSSATDANWNLSLGLGWPKTPSDENNNDKSRWDFAR